MHDPSRAEFNPRPVESLSGADAAAPSAEHLHGLRDIAARAAREEKAASTHWEGTFAEYLDLVERQPSHARNAWQRMAEMIESHGSTPGGPGEPARWHLFDDSQWEGGPPGPDAIFGIDESLHRLVMTLRAGARGLGPERRIILLHGPVGSAKSTIARVIKRGLEAYTRTAEGAIFTFDWHVDGEVISSPMNQDPLLLLPTGARAEVEARLNADRDPSDRLTIEGQLDPVSAFWMKTLLERHEGDWGQVMEHIKVRRFTFSESGRVGIGTYQPKDEKNQDSTELTGDLNYRKIAEFGSDSDPRAFNFDGEFNVANRGFVEFIEVLKLDVAFLYDLLGATQEHSIKPKKFQATHIDEVILGHTNEPEFRKLQSNELMEAFRDRTIRIDVPYNLEISSEASIHRRRFGERGAEGRRLAPHCLEVASLWAVLTRLEEPQHPTLSLVQKARLYDGTEVTGFTSMQVDEFREMAEREGLDGISPRYIQDRVATLLVEPVHTIGPRDVLDAIEDGLGAHSMVASEPVRRRYRELVSLVREEYDQIIREEVEVAIAADDEALDRLCANYLDNVRAYTTREQVQGADGAPREPDERLMRSIEERTDIPDARKDDFRHELMNYIAAVHLEGGQFDYRENRRLRRALELKLFEDQRDSIQLTSLISTVVDPQADEKLAALRARLCERFGYDDRSAGAVLTDVAGLFARQEAAEEDPAVDGAATGSERAA